MRLGANGFPYETPEQWLQRVKELNTSTVTAANQLSRPAGTEKDLSTADPNPSSFSGRGGNLGATPSLLTLRREKRRWNFLKAS